MKSLRNLIGLIMSVLPLQSFAAGGNELLNLNMPWAPASIVALMLFILAYALVMVEEFTHLRKSKPVVLVAGFIWIIIASICHHKGIGPEAAAAVRHNILDYAELFLFLLVAMTYVITMQERMVFEALRSWLVRKDFSYRQMFWITGILAFFISPFADNLTTALLMCAVVMAIGGNDAKFISLCCINIVIAANAGGAYSPFGDITTLMVWQDGVLPFHDFFYIFIPAAVSFLVPASVMHFAISNKKPTSSDEVVKMKFGARRVIILFFLTIATAVSFHHFLELPPMLGMMTGLGYLQIFGYYLKKRGQMHLGSDGEYHPFDIFRKIERAEWDTLLFFYGVVLCVGGLATLGYLSITSDFLYHHIGQTLPAAHHATPANVIIGLLSAIVDNIPMMFAVLTMHPTMSDGQWLLVTLTAGIGGSLLSIGSAAGVALMGQTRGMYTFMSHLKWTWVIFLGYVAGIFCHLWLNADLF